MPQLKHLCWLLVGLTAASGFAANTIHSPDNNLTVSFGLRTNGTPAYRIDYRNQPVVLESRLGFEPAFADRFSLLAASTNTHFGQWTNNFGERKIVPDNFSELNVELKHESGRIMRVTFRAYNEGAALRYSFPRQDAREFVFTNELTEFHFPSGTLGYEESGTEGEYHRVDISEMEPWCERPLTLEFSNGMFAALAEAANESYPRMLLSPSPAVRGALVTALGGMTANTGRFMQRYDPTATLRAGDATPWRMLVLGDKPGDLLERNYLMLNLNPPVALADTGWIKPGKLMRDVTLTTANSKAVIDFAATAGLRYVLLDSGWYGSEGIDGDATKARAPHLDVPEIVRYGREKGVGLILYVDRHQMKKQRDELFPLYEQWGVAGVKIGFVDVGPQSETAWITETMEKAAGHHLLLNIHDGYRATGNNRTWPNLLTVEGIRGNEHFPTAEHDCTLPFTRYIAGIADYTVCYYSPRLIHTTHAHQLAMAVISFSPLQSLFWYDKPSGYDGEPEIEFFRRVPTVWDETRVLAGEIGKFASVARRSGDDWFVGTINNSEPRVLKLSFSFLPTGQKFTAHIYSDDDSVKTRTKVAVETRVVDDHSSLPVELKNGGGQAIWITPAAK